MYMVFPHFLRLSRGHRVLAACDQGGSIHTSVSSQSDTIDRVVFARNHGLLYAIPWPGQSTYIANVIFQHP